MTAPSRIEPFATEVEIADYLSGDSIECLECGRRFRMLTGRHMATHGMTQEEYRARWGLPRGAALAIREVREARSAIIRHAIDSGALTHDHLAVATEKARAAARPDNAPASKAAQAKRVQARRPGDHSLLPDGATRASGRDAVRTRLYQQAYRALKRGNSELMAAFRLAYPTE